MIRLRHKADKMNTKLERRLYSSAFSISIHFK